MNPQSRKWLITINNPQEHGLTIQKIKEILNNLCLVYFCWSEEIGEQGTYHIHIYIYSSAPIRFSTLKRKFPTAHIEKAYGTSAENKEYVQKSGKWENTEKADTSIKGTFFEEGELPTQNAEKNPKMYDIVQDVKDGKSTAEIVDNSPSAAYHVQQIDTLRQAILAQKYLNEIRNLTVTYIYCKDGICDYAQIYKDIACKDICRINYYKRTHDAYFDTYNGQKTLSFENFESQIDIEYMMTYLDGYPMQLHARYYDRVACYTKVYIISNLPIEKQYDWEPKHLRTAFSKKLNRVLIMQGGKLTYEYPKP